MSNQTDTPTYTITGRDAIRIALRDKLTLRKYADPTEGARERVSPDEAERIAEEDESLIYVHVEPIGWNVKPAPEGYHYSDFWARSGRYYGPDSGGIEPVFSEA